MTFKFFSVISGSAIKQEFDAAEVVSKIMPIRTMISYLYLRKEKTWAIPENIEETYLDSGAYSQINNKGDYPFEIQEYVDFCNKYEFDHVSTLDYPCDERYISDLSIKDRIEKSVENTSLLIDEIPNLIPVLQGKTIEDYLYSIELYKEQGLLKDYVGIGSICIRKKTSEIVRIIKKIRHNLPNGTKIHCYGLEIPSIKLLYKLIESSDSHSWGQVLHIGGRVIFFDGKKLNSFPRNKLPIDAAHIVCLHAYNLYINHITRKNENLLNFHTP